jgi:D-tyrosyl-tRNA(Tyr) deacylase
MIGLLQRVSAANVRVQDELVGAIGAGLLVLVAVQRGDGPAQVRRLAERLVSYRVFEDPDGKMNRDVREANAGVLLVPQFTLAADTRKGNRPSFSGAAEPALGSELFELLVREVRARCREVATGRFGATMSVSLVNEGPVTIWLQVPPDPAGATADRPPAVAQP